jgi:hypothetical protein
VDLIFEQPLRPAMTTFAKASFNAAKYASIRPTYPKVLYDTIFAYHARNLKASWDLAVDLGCGTGAWMRLSDLETI